MPPSRVKLLALDFDGVVADSYSCLPDVYDELIKRLRRPNRGFLKSVLIELEDILDYLGVWSIMPKIWELLLNLDAEEALKLYEEYWKLRVRCTKVNNGLYDVVESARRMGFKPITLSGCDDSTRRKKARIQALGVYELFDYHIVYGCESRYKSLEEAILSLLPESEILVYVDDKSSNLNRLANIPTEALVIVRAVFKPPFYHAYSWSEKLKVKVLEISTLSELVDILASLEELKRREADRNSSGARVGRGPLGC